MELRITGLEQVQRALQELPVEIVTVGFAKALNASAGVIAGAVETIAAGMPEYSDTPLSEHVVINVEVDGNRRGGTATVGFDKSADERTGIPQDLKAYLVEYGHLMVTHKPDKKVVGIVHPKPFMRPAFEASADRAVEVFAETLIDSLSEVGVEKA
jgi:hypothetical protein